MPNKITTFFFFFFFLKRTWWPLILSHIAFVASTWLASASSMWTIPKLRLLWRNGQWKGKSHLNRIQACWRASWRYKYRFLTLFSNVTKPEKGWVCLSFLVFMFAISILSIVCQCTIVNTSLGFSSGSIHFSWTVLKVFSNSPLQMVNVQES